MPPIIGNGLGADPCMISGRPRYPHLIGSKPAMMATTVIFGHEPDSTAPSMNRRLEAFARKGGFQIAGTAP